MRYYMPTLALLGLLAAPAGAVEKSAIDDAIERGVAGLKKAQGAEGRWGNAQDHIGATALAGLTLLECGAGADDKAVRAAAAAVRKVALTTTHTYSVSLCILFLDRLDQASDTPLIEAMIVNLLGGQNASGGWGYDCVQAFTAQELRDLAQEAGGGARELRGARDLNKLPAKGKRGAADLPKAVQGKLQVLNRLGGVVKDDGPIVGGDNSNTQFATLALWAGRRYGVPTQAALLKIDARFRTTQEADGTWGYLLPRRTGVVASAAEMMGMNKSAAMTCAGLLGLICGHGASADVKLAKEKLKDKDAKAAIDLSKDARVKAGLQALGTAVGTPVGWKGTGQPPAAVGAARGKAYYFLWSLERVCVLLGLETIAKKDWYTWGAEILLANQGHDGRWAAGMYGENGADTCFALLFLKKSNLARDLSGSIGGFKDPGARTLKGGGVGGGGLKGGNDKLFDPKDIGAKPETKETGKKETPKEDRPKARTVEQETADRLSRDLVRARGQLREGILNKLRDSKGSAYTEALAGVIPKLEAESKKLAREALADRLTRMRAATLREYFAEKDPELRRAAALAAGQRDAKELAPDLIKLLDDPDPAVPPAARASLKEMAGKDLGAKAEPWREWWKKQARE